MGLLQQASLVITPNAVKAGKLYSVVPIDGTGDLTVARNTSATRVNSAGLIETVGNNIARLDYSNGSCPSILVEPQRTNLNLYSEDLANAYWFKFQSSILANADISPSGDFTADKIVEDTTNNFHSIFIDRLTFSIGQSLTRSVYLKADNRSWVSLAIAESGTYYRAYFNLSNGTIGNVSSSITASIEQAANGYYKCIITRVLTTTSPSSFAIELASDNGKNIYLGNGTSGVFVWGAQLEAGSNATSYIPTTTSTVTRVEDRNNIVLTNKPFWNKNNFTIYWEGTFLNGSYNQATFGFGNSTDIVAIGASICFYNNGVGVFSKQDGTSPGGLVIGSPLPNGSKYKLIIKREGTEIKWFRNGVLLGVRTGEVVDYAYLGLNSGGSTYYLDKSFMIPSSLTDQQCINLTTL
mgnify:CR=1 FL=1